MDHEKVYHLCQETIPESRDSAEKYHAVPAPDADTRPVDGRGYPESACSRADPHSGRAPGALPLDINPNPTLPFSLGGCSPCPDPYTLQAVYTPYSAIHQPYGNINTFGNCNGITGISGQQGPILPDPNVFPTNTHSQDSRGPSIVPSPRALTERANPVAHLSWPECNSNAALNAGDDVKNSTTNKPSGGSQPSSQSFTFIACDPSALPDSKRKRKQDEHHQDLSEVGGACIPCVHSRKKCDLDEVCAPCMQRRKPDLPCLRGREGIWLYKEVISPAQPPEVGFRCLALSKAKHCSFPQVNSLLDKLEAESQDSAPPDHLALLLQWWSRSGPYAVSVELLKRPPNDHILSESQKSAIIKVARDIVPERGTTMQHASGLMSPVVDISALVGFLFSINNASLFLQPRLHCAARLALAYLLVFTAQAIAQCSEEFAKIFLNKLRGKKTFQELVGDINLTAALYYQTLTGLSECRFCPMVEDIFSCIRGRLQPVTKTIARLLQCLAKKYKLANPVSFLSNEGRVPGPTLLDFVRDDLKLAFDYPQPSLAPQAFSMQGQLFSTLYFLDVPGLLSAEGYFPRLSSTDLDTPDVFEQDAGQDGATLGISDRPPITITFASPASSNYPESEVPPSSDHHHESNVQLAQEDTSDSPTEHPRNLGAPASSASQAHDGLYPAPPSLTHSGLGPSATHLQSSQWDCEVDDEIFQGWLDLPDDDKCESGEDDYRMTWGQPL